MLTSGDILEKRARGNIGSDLETDIAELWVDLCRPHRVSSLNAFLSARQSCQFTSEAVIKTYSVFSIDWYELKDFVKNMICFSSTTLEKSWRRTYRMKSLIYLTCVNAVVWLVVWGRVIVLMSCVERQTAWTSVWCVSRSTESSWRIGDQQELKKSLKTQTVFPSQHFLHIEASVFVKSYTVIQKQISNHNMASCRSL